MHDAQDVCARRDNRLLRSSNTLRIDLGWDVIAYEITCKCNGHPRRVWFFRALPSEILVGWLVDGER